MSIHGAIDTPELETDSMRALWMGSDACLHLHECIHSRDPGAAGAASSRQVDRVHHSLERQ